jgi:hypothetical protein
MDDDDSMAGAPSDSQSEVHMMLVHGANMVFTPTPEPRRCNLLLAGLFTNGGQGITTATQLDVVRQ